VHCLVLTRFLPLPANAGAKQRTAALVSRLARRLDVTVCGFDDGTADQRALAELGIRVVSARWPTPTRDRAGGLLKARSVSASKCWSRSLADGLTRVVEDRPVDVVVLEFPQMAVFLTAVPDAPLVLAWHNVESALVESWAGTQRAPARPAYLAEARMLRATERALLREADVVSVAGGPDAARLPQPRRGALVCPNGVEPGPPLPDAGGPNAVFVGLMSYPPNVDGARWLTTEVWPGVLAAVPAARLAIVGAQPSATVRRLASATIRVTGAVDDVRPELERARVAVAPLRAGGGTRLKVLEALNAGRPVVATSPAAEGLERLRGRGLVVADGADAFAAAVSRLLADPQRSARLGRLGHRAVRAFSWDLTLAPLVERIVAAARRQQWVSAPPIELGGEDSNPH
jgi:glycosyltransferase involved in cell wall biosynthesis